MKRLTNLQLVRLRDILECASDRSSPSSDYAGGTIVAVVGCLMIMQNAKFNDALRFVAENTHDVSPDSIPPTWLDAYKKHRQKFLKNSGK